ncbi:MAG: type II toxin-antitoxin system RelE/ParE family toxin [Gammaproteobacteria bacterium]|nr:type II toxin-antitoxin system RelE/ParE family toxin [Aquabacterium parvum]MBU0915557.1 type II toxin-antitoxin system RelE/ParE family toxin [Gammaproteobacteria bacterium]
MPQVRFSPPAIRDLERLREFLRPKSPIAAKRAGEVIVKAVQVLGLQPKLGRPIEDMPDEFREWIIDFGDSGYVARYRIDTDAITILAVRHQKEVGY